MMDTLRIIGPRLLATLGVLVAFNLALFATWFLWATPMRTDAERNLRKLDGEIKKLRSSIVNIKDEMIYYNDNIDKFNALKDKGFILSGEEDNTQAQVFDFISAQRTANRIINMQYEITEPTTIKSREIELTKHMLQKRQITLSNIAAFFDTDIFRMIHQLNTQAAGHTRITSVSLVRPNPDNFEKSLERIALGTQEGLITATILLDWYNMAPLPEENLPTTPRR
ncbi:MAG: hypothetical protein HND56_09150 [Pseudomonadota bacterium]|nr:hypothetical protein [Pseudomonadota bacterium]QKK05844.1 MAG: hypothetical protein HND56_09150 [Pseudomonadota bacterium]